MVVALKDRLLGRFCAEDIPDPADANKILVSKDQVLDEHFVEEIENANINRMKVRSAVTCETRFGVCSKCYGRDLGRGHVINIGEAVGVVAAQSIGEPGTQLTMRTFHIGGAASSATAESNITARTEQGRVKLLGVNLATNTDGRRVVMARFGELVIQDANGNDRERHKLPYGALLNVSDGEAIESGQVVAEWKPHVNNIVAEMNGVVEFVDISVGDTVTEQVDEITGRNSFVVQASVSRDLRPQIAPAKSTALPHPGNFGGIATA